MSNTNPDDSRVLTGRIAQDSSTPADPAAPDIHSGSPGAKKPSNPFRRFMDRYPNLWEFILFNILSNISTITRFILAWVGTAVFVNALHITQPFSFLIFNYSSPKSNGLGGFLTFLMAEAIAQVVNFFVQMKWVFKSDSSFKNAAWKYIILAVIIVIVNLVLPPWVTSLCHSWGWNDQVAATVASVVNTLLAVIVSYPLLKWWIMPKSKKHEEEIRKARQEASRA